MGLDQRAQLPLVAHGQQPAQRTDGGGVPAVERLVGVFDPRQDHRGDAVIAVERSDGQRPVAGPAHADRRCELDRKPLFGGVERPGILKRLRPAGDVELRRIDVDQQIGRLHPDRGGDGAQFVGARHHLSAFDLGQANIGDGRQPRGQGEQLRLAMGAPQLTDAIGKNDQAMRIDRYRARAHPAPGRRLVPPHACQSPP